MAQIIEIISSLLLVTGGLFGLIGSYGLVRLREGMQRLHAPTKATTIGVGAVLIAAGLVGGVASKAGLVAGFLFLTAPLTALFLARVHLFRSLPPGAVPPTGTGVDWASRSETP